ncbi:MAG TPA: hypothetical protein VEY06_11500, partial [Flavisolibacter sp.]|nr:hypothetical protein [Flavisolibacter sp.]
MNFISTWKQKNLLLYNRWPWHVLFWMGYILFRFWPYYITVYYYPPIFLEYMLLSEIPFVAVTYFTVWLYKRFFKTKKYLTYFIIGAGSWILYLYGRTVFQFYYLGNEARFQHNIFADILLGNITVVTV